MRRRRRRRRHFGLWLFIIIIVAVASTTLFLIYRGAKVSGPNSNASSVTKVIDTTPTNQANKTVSGTWRADGAAKDPDGEKLHVRVSLRLRPNGHYRRELKIQGQTLRTIVDSGTYTGRKTFKLKSTQAVIFTYASKAAQNAHRAKATSRYGQEIAAYPSYLNKVLNNRVSKTTYEYVNTRLSLKHTSQTVPTIAAAISQQTSRHQTTGESSTADDDTSDATSSDDTSSSDASSKMTVSEAQAIVEQQYPSSDYTITAMGQTGDNFTFVVIDQQTHDNQYVTVNGDGQIEQ
ncbi:hypothetical protein [Lacticaseibacillus sp. N501-2]|uniref:hypothetical protein n=1 Tax=Lacticaseibacillus salsurae TaxID=3367729 RepID=UPI0038B2C0C4